MNLPIIDCSVLLITPPILKPFPGFLVQISFINGYFVTVSYLLIYCFV